MFECELPFDHKTLHLELEDKNFAGVMEGHQNEFKTTKSQEELVEESLANPYRYFRKGVCFGARNKADGVPAGIHEIRQERSAETEYHDN